MTPKTFLLPTMLCAALLLSVTATALAQSKSGSIRGAVVDPSGALIPHAQITVSSATGFSRTTKSGPMGTFSMPHLAAGTYSISIDAAGFTPTLQDGIHVVGDTVTRETIKLGISVNQFIEVFASDDGRGSTHRPATDSL